MSSKDKIVKVVANADFNYLLLRAQEEIQNAEKENDNNEAERRLVMATQLITMARAKLPCNHLHPKTTAKPDQKQKSS
jgi:hypothetical protein